MNFIFIVQGEGRGHMTQAISLFQILKASGHEIGHVIVGKSKRRELPEFFVQNIDAPITQLESPNFITDRNSKSVSVFKTLFVNLVRLPIYLTSTQKIDQIVKQEKPDTIINFYDFLSGLYFLLKRPKTTHIALAHQFLLSHPEFEFPKGRIYDRLSLITGNKLAGYKAKKLLCLSFRPMRDDPKNGLIVVPPLLREEIKTQEVSDKDFFLVYMVNHGYADQVRLFHRNHPELKIHCFWDKKGEPEELKEGNLTFHRLNDKKFINLMSSCKGYLSTAGFESICEAMFMGKPVLMVPVKGHYEQSCNAIDAKRAGAGISSQNFDLELLLEYLPLYKPVKDDFTAWIQQTNKLFLQNLVENDHSVFR